MQINVLVGSLLLHNKWLTDREERLHKSLVSDLKAKSALTLVNVSKGGQSSTSNIIDSIVIYIL